MSHQNRGGNRRGGGNRNAGGGNRQGGGGGPGRRNNAPPVDENNPVLQCFLEYARELDDKHDRYERIVKCSRDITIESKRIIFLLHTVDAKKDNHKRVCAEARGRLENLCHFQFQIIAKELHGRDQYQYARAYTAGMQEFIEAYTFYEYVQSKNISHWKPIQEQLCYKVPLEKLSPSSGPEKENAGDESDGIDQSEGKDSQIDLMCLLRPIDFVLGVGDLTGEIMRKSINSLGSGDVDSCFEHCRFLQELYKGFVSVSNAYSRDFSHKLNTLRQSLLKSEFVCYNVKVRGGEAAKWGNTDDTGLGAILKESLDDDEGVFF